MRILSIVGARPQFIKLAPLSNELRKKHEEIILHTGQHYDYNMSGKLFDDLGIPEPDINLNIGSSSHGKQTGVMLSKIEEIIVEKEVDLVIIFGDTNSTLAGALAAAKLSVPIVHVEAGLRSFNRTMPEEINRVLTDHCSDYLFAPTQTAAANLEKENLKDQVYITGDVMVDALNNALSIAEKKSKVLNKLELMPDSYFLLTLHRPYNVDEPEALSLIMEGLSEVNTQVIFPIHPRTKKNIKYFDIITPPNVRLIDPQGYLDFIQLQKNAHKIITDSGGVQKEAYILNTPCITLRTETEWTGTVENGWNNLVNIHTQNIAEEIMKFHPSDNPAKIFGEDVAIKMASIINDFKNH